MQQFRLQQLQVTGIQEYVEDTAAAILTGATHSGLSATYDDTEPVLLL
jgi:hypothetical protein